MRIEFKILIVSVIVLIYSAIVLGFANNPGDATFIKGLSGTLVALSSLAIVGAGISLYKRTDENGETLKDSFRRAYGNSV